MDQTKKRAEAETSANVERSTKYRKDKKPIFQENTLTDYLDVVNEIEEDDDDGHGEMKKMDGLEQLGHTPEVGV